MENAEPSLGQPTPDEDPAARATAEAKPDASREALRRLEERLERASEAAERLLEEAIGATARAREPKVPPAGWQAPEPDSDGRAARDIELWLQIVRSLRDLIPAELQERLAHAVHELLLALRALVDWYIERLERGRGETVQVEDIPIL
jgi:hypothetical protein